jgi:positive regulator of sigma E activity
MVTLGSNKKAWWVCDKGHEWESKIANRKVRGCPYCAGRRVCSDNNLAVLNPILAKQWHPTKNGDLSPNMVTLGSNKKAWWVCNKGHEWEAVIYSRQKGRCPYCAGRRVCSDNNLAVLNPTLAKQWHPTKNGDLSPNMVTLGSNKKAWWVCDKGHEWEATIPHRTDLKHPTGCPYCAGKKACSDNNLAALNPTLAKQWHPTKNGDLSPNMVTLGSNKKVWWVCDRGHEWEATIKRRTGLKHPTGCPYCSRRKS